MKNLLIFMVLPFVAFTQININNQSPFNSPQYLVDSLFQGAGIESFNHSFSGDSIQLGYFNGLLCNLNLDSGIVMSTGDIAVLDPNFGSSSDLLNNNNIDDADLLTIANSVPPLIGQNFSVFSINDVAVLEFDFIPEFSYINFNYVFASQEYFFYENSAFNDVFGFFVSGPGIEGPYASPESFPNGSVNIAIFESLEENSLGTNLPITVSSIHSYYNSEFFVDNQSFESVNDANGFTIPMTAQLDVIAGETYHMRLAIADCSDNVLNSYVFFESPSLTSQPVAYSMSFDFIDTNPQSTYGITDGFIEFLFEGGFAPYTVELTSSNGFSETYLDFQAFEVNTISNLTSGEYVLKVIDANQFAQSSSFTIDYSGENSWNCLSEENSNFCEEVEGGSGQFASLNDCSQICDVSGITELGVTEFSLYPNPLTNISILKLNNENKEIFTIVVTDIKGQTVRRYSNVSSNLMIKKGQLEKGMYYIHVLGNQKFGHKAFVIE